MNVFHGRVRRREIPVKVEITHVQLDVNDQTFNILTLIYIHTSAVISASDHPRVHDGTSGQHSSARWRFPTTSTAKADRRCANEFSTRATATSSDTRYGIVSPRHPVFSYDTLVTISAV